MGTWDTSSFGNDIAVDWTYGLQGLDDLSLIEDTLKKFHALGKEYVEAPDAQEAIAAADTLARLKGHFYTQNNYTENVDKWVEKHKIIPAQQLIESAIWAVDRILTPPSELLELWQESDKFEIWVNHLNELKKYYNANK